MKCDLISRNSHGPAGTHQAIPQDSRSPEQDLKLGPSECGTVLTRVLLYSVSLIGLFRRCYIRSDCKVNKAIRLQAWTGP